MIGCGLLLLYGMPFRVKGLDWALWAALILQAGLVAWQMVGRDPISFVAGGTNITVNRSDLANIDIVHYAWGSLLNTGRTAAWAALVLPVAALSKRLPAWARVSGLLAGLFVLDAMGSILGYLAAAFALGAYLYHRRIVSGRTAIILCGVFLFTFSVLAFQHGETAQRRVQVWKAAVWWMQHSRPNEWVFGKGLGGFAELDIRDPEHPKKFIVWKKAHNEFVQLGVEAGAVALALFLGLWIASFRTAARARDGGVTLASLAALAVIASGHFPFREPTLAILSLSVLARVLSWEHLTCPKTAAISV
ncbi:hypothetical protein CMI37_35460 [Candidatus Pacearchaeota archaeon]|nr:hypothetical protein [Candidatus Pacearchaeota archaeon]